MISSLRDIRMNGFYELAIIGAGPAGIATAAEAINAGISPSKVLILEKESNHNHSIRKFYPEKKLVTANYKGKDSNCAGILCIPDLSKQDTIDYFDQVIESYGLHIHYNENVFSVEKTKHGFQVNSSTGVFNAKACVIAIGILGRPNKPSYPIPKELKMNVTFDITSTPIFNKKVLVVGGGDSASEYAQYLVDQGNSVTLSYRREKFSRMLDHNLDAIYALEQKKKLELLYNSNVKEIINDNGPTVVFNEAKLENTKFDHIVLALGGTTPKNFLTLLGIQFEDNWPILDHHYQTNIEGLYLAGDLVQGPKGGSIITAFNSAFEIVNHLNKSIFKTDLKEEQYWQDLFF